MSIIFLSYRREDSKAMCELIYGRLVDEFSEANVFIDLEKMRGGELWKQKIDTALQQAAAQVVVIGPKWLDIRDSNGVRRLEDPHDVVRHEIEAAITRGIPIVPVLVDDAQTPATSKLPDSLRKVTDYNAIPIRHRPDFDTDMRRLSGILAQWVPRLPRRSTTSIAMAAASAAWFAFVIGCVALLGATATLLGILSVPAPIALFVMKNPAVSLLIGGGVVLAASVSLIVLRTGNPSFADGEIDVKPARAGPRPFVSLVTSSLTTLVFFGLFGTMMLQPQWCQSTPLCLASSLPLINGNAHDSRMEVYLIAVQSSTSVLAGDPQQYTLKNLPQQLSAATRIDRSNPDPYRVAVGIRSLEQGHTGLIIEQVFVVVDAVPPSPYPLNVWTPGSPIDYHTNPYLADYAGQGPGARLEARYVLVPGGKVQLAPGESDQLDVQLQSRVPADLRFHLEIVYKTGTDPTRYTLTLPQRFEIVFSDASNWHPYAPQQDGHFAATP